MYRPGQSGNQTRHVSDVSSDGDGLGLKALLLDHHVTVAHGVRLVKVEAMSSRCTVTFGDFQSTGLTMAKIKIIFKFTS